MVEAKVLGKIGNVRYGHGGYQDAMFGVSFELEMPGSGVGDFWGSWPESMWTPHCKWSKEDARNEQGAVASRLSVLMREAKVSTLGQLKGKPIEITLHGHSLKSWRILKEVL